jgi:nucleoside-diphosphate-sugar epimerase
MKILVTGGNGFLASHLIPELQKLGHAVSVLILPSSGQARARQEGVAVHLGNVCDPDSLAPAMREVDAVFHLAAAIGVRRPMRAYYAVNVTGTGNVCHAALAAGVRRVVHVSTTSVYQQGLGSPAREDFPLSPLRDPYPQTKAEGERLVRRMIAENHLPASIVRVSTVYGPGDYLNFGRIADRLLSSSSIVIGSGRNRVPFAYVADVVRGLILVLEQDRAEGQIYNITDDRWPTQAELLREIARHVGAKTPRIHVPYRLLYSAALAAERAADLARRPNPLVTRFGVALYGADNRVSIDKARQELGYEPQVPLAEGVSLAAAWYGERLASPVLPRPGSDRLMGVTH